MALRFESLRLTGWKSIKDTTIEFRPLNILIGANSAGKWKMPASPVVILKR